MTLVLDEEVRSADVSERSVLAVRPLTVVAEGEEFVVGDPERNVYVMLPSVGVQAIELFRTGATIADVRATVTAAAGHDVDVDEFARSLIDLGFAMVADEASAAARQIATPSRWETAFSPPRVRFLFSRQAWVVYVICAIGTATLLAARPGLFPSSSDMFFLGTPARSIAALTPIMFAVAGIHEAFHWLAARAEGVTARFAVSRRLYLLTLETDLSQLWGVPRRRRFGPLLAGMASNAVGLFLLLTARAAADEGWWTPSDGVARALAALAFVQFTMIASQLWIFMRTDVYALLVAATGCVNLWRVNQLVIRRMLRRLRDDEARELQEAHQHDLAVARWYVWVYVAGIGLAAWFFVAFFAPATIRVVVWMGETLADGRLDSVRFWEALVFGSVMLLPKALTAGIALRDLRIRRARTISRTGRRARTYQ